MSEDKSFKILLTSFFTLLGSYQLFSAGLAASDRYFASMVASLIIGVFCYAALAAIVAGWFATERSKRIADRRDLERKIDEVAAKTSEVFQEMIESIKPISSHKEDMENAVMEAIDSVTGSDRAPTEDEISQIEDKFHEITGDHYLKLGLEKGGMTMEIGKEPFAPSTTTTTTGTSIDTVTKSKSQQRREAVTKSAKKPNKKG